MNETRMTLMKQIITDRYICDYLCFFRVICVLFMFRDHYKYKTK